jgi:transcriptional accessory protein Tex/SPT6
MYPALERGLRDELTEKSEKFVVSECGKKYRELLMSSPFYYIEENKADIKARVVGVVYD